MKNHVIYVTLATLTTLLTFNPIATQAQQITTAEMRYLLNTHCSGKITRNVALNPQQCANLYRAYQYRIRSYQGNNNYQQQYRNRYGRDGSYSNYNLESIRESNCLASSSGC
ncbi:hypothetical protein [Cyanothece sp. BG0011]|uniref:hypothetical protein n=1 Tax=Cyanothece sp. BG0011 TaxID=2082950 RepID=UPI000D1DBD3D|nr:hypothetical protein [Cyanothece sp. BG0011]